MKTGIQSINATPFKDPNAAAENQSMSLLSQKMLHLTWTVSDKAVPNSIPGRHKTCFFLGKLNH